MLIPHGQIGFIAQSNEEGPKMSEGISGGKMSGAKMSEGMTKCFRFNSPCKLTDGINLTDRINLTDNYKTSLWRGTEANIFLLSLDCGRY